MAYTPTEWKSGDVITAEKLNNIEEGIGENNNSKREILYVNIRKDTSTNNWIPTCNGVVISTQEIVEAWNKGKVIRIDVDTESLRSGCYISEAYSFEGNNKIGYRAFSPSVLSPKKENNEYQMIVYSFYMENSPWGDGSDQIYIDAIQLQGAEWVELQL